MGNKGDPTKKTTNHVIPAFQGFSKFAGMHKGGAA